VQRFCVLALQRKCVHQFYKYFETTLRKSHDWFGHNWIFLSLIVPSLIFSNTVIGRCFQYNLTKGSEGRMNPIPFYVVNPSLSLPLQRAWVFLSKGPKSHIKLTHYDHQESSHSKRIISSHSSRCPPLPSGLPSHCLLGPPGGCPPPPTCWPLAWAQFGCPNHNCNPAKATTSAFCKNQWLKLACFCFHVTNTGQIILGVAQTSF